MVRLFVPGEGTHTYKLIFVTLIKQDDNFTRPSRSIYLEARRGVALMGKVGIGETDGRIRPASKAKRPSKCIVYASRTDGGIDSLVH